METLASQLVTAPVIGAILLALLAETALLAALRVFAHRGPALGSTLAMGLAGAGLFVALLASLLDPPRPLLVAGGMLLALAAHLVDLRLRWSGR
ncbi:MAG: hypothetical protein ACK5TE_00990 [Pseudomonadota bacterium]